MMYFVFFVLFMALLAAGAFRFVAGRGVLTIILPHKHIPFELLHVFAVSFIALTLFAFNRDFGLHVAWYYVLLLGSLVALVLAYKDKRVLSLLFGIGGVYSALFGWLYTSEQTTAVGMSISVLLAACMYTVAVLHKGNVYEPFRRVYRYLGIIIPVAMLFSLSTRASIVSIAREYAKRGEIHGVGAITLVVVCTALFLFLAWYGMQKRKLSVHEMIVSVVYSGFFALLSWLNFSMFVADRATGGQYTKVYWLGDLSYYGFVFATILNILLFIFLLLVILLGYRKKEDRYINLGILFLFIFVVVKYFDWFFDFLDKSIFFVSAGILMLAVGWFLERGRRAMISATHES